MNSATGFGLDTTRRLATWDAAADLATRLEAFYAEIRTIARTGLTASVRNDAAYRQAAADMVAAFSVLESLDGEARALALTTDVDLPSLDLETLGTLNGGAPAR
jgi:hypothetical protein